MTFVQHRDAVCRIGLVVAQRKPLKSDGHGARTTEEN